VRRLHAALPRDVQVRTGAQQAAKQSADIRDNLGFLRVALLAFAGISLFVGAFIIFNTFSITVAQRTREFALLRTLGASRRQVLASVLAEGLAIGVIGAAAGLALGIFVAKGLRALFTAVGADLPSNGTVILSRTIVVSLLVGTLVTLVSSLGPALRATRVPPVAALREGAVLPPGRGARFAFPVAVLLTLAGLGLMLGGLFGGASDNAALSMTGAGAGLLFLGVALLSPRLVGPIAAVVGAPIERLSGITGRLARANAVRQPGRTAATAAALMIGVALVAFASIFAASARSTIRDAVESGSKAQVIVQNTDGFSGFSPGVARELGRLPGVAVVASLARTQARVDGEKTGVTGVDTATFGRLYDLRDGAEAVARLGPGDAVAGKGYAQSHGVHVGDVVRVETPARKRVTLRISGIVDDKSKLLAPLTVRRDVLRDAFGATRDNLVFAGFAGAKDDAALRARIDKALARDFPEAKAQTTQQFIDDQAGQVNTLLNLIYALLALAVIVSLFGIVNTLVLSITERTRELGMLRAIGTSRRQVRRMIRYEAVITALIGGVLGAAMGIMLALLVSRVVDGLILAVPVVSLVVLLVLSGFAGVLAAVLPARRAARLDVLRALDYE
jgi:putative ABC transport system permease protein